MSLLMTEELRSLPNRRRALTVEFDVPAGWTDSLFSSRLVLLIEQAERLELEFAGAIWPSVKDEIPMGPAAFQAFGPPATDPEE